MKDIKPLPTSFADYKNEGHIWITLAKGVYYPDYLEDAIKLYTPYLEAFGQLMQTSESSERLFQQISAIKEQGTRVQLARIFRKYVSPETPVEMLKVKSKVVKIVEQFGSGFRPHSGSPEGLLQPPYT